MNHLGLTLVAGAALGLKFHFKLTGTTLVGVTEPAPELK